MGQCAGRISRASRLSAGRSADAEAGELEGQLARFAKAASVQELLAQALDDAKFSLQARQIALRAMARSALKEPPAGVDHGPH